LRADREARSAANRKQSREARETKREARKEKAMQIRSFDSAEISNSLSVRIYTPSAPSHGAAKQWVRNINVWVVVHAGPIGNINSRSILRRYSVATEVDSRYAGPRSACGQALARAERVAAQVRDSIAAQSAILQMYAA
jgi:hypothetical protein